jgi:hypothetical protein
MFMLERREGDSSKRLSRDRYTLSAIEGLVDGVKYERERQYKHDWRKLFFHAYRVAFLAFATLWFLVTYL